MNGALIAAGAGLFAGLGYVVWKAHQQAKASGGSTCEIACGIGAAAGGVAGAGQGCATVCDSKLVQTVATSVGNIVSDIGGVITGGKTDPRGQNGNLAAVLSAPGLSVFSLCPQGTMPRFGSESMTAEHRFGLDTTITCVGADGHVAGTVDSKGVFHAYQLSAEATKPPVPTNTPTSPSGGFSLGSLADVFRLPGLMGGATGGGVTTTATTRVSSAEQLAEQQAALQRLRAVGGF